MVVGGGAAGLAQAREALAAARASVSGLEWWPASVEQVREVLGELEATVRAAQAAQLSALAELSARGESAPRAPEDDPTRPLGAAESAAAVRRRARETDARAWLASRLGVHPATAARRQVTSAFVAADGAATGAALAAGEISVEVADVVAGTVVALPPRLGADGRAQVERVLLDHAPHVTVPVLRHHARALLARLELVDAAEGEVWPPEGQDGLARAEARAHRRRELHLSSDITGVWHLRGRLSPEAGATLATAIDALAAPAPSGTDGPDLRSAAQRRADALVDLADRMLALPPDHDQALPSTGRARARVVVTCDLEVLTRAVRGAGVLADQAPLSAGAVRRLACDAEVVPAVLGTASEPLDLGRSAYAVSPALRRALVLRDGGCAAPGCSRPPGWCDAHHVVHWADGGPTDLDNLVLACGHHHRSIHAGSAAVHVVDGRPVVLPVGEPPPVRAPRPWRSRLHDLAHRLEGRAPSAEEDATPSRGDPPEPDPSPPPPDPSPPSPDPGHDPPEAA